MFTTSQQLNLDFQPAQRHVYELSQAQNVLGKPLSRLRIPNFFFLVLYEVKYKLFNLALQKFF